MKYLTWSQGDIKELHLVIDTKNKKIRFFIGGQM
jgi:hypothetical protein